MGAPASLLARMGWNLLVDVVVGAVPFLGDLFDAGFKANMRNLALLDRHAQARDSRGGPAAASSRCWCRCSAWCCSGRSPSPVFLVQLAFSRPVL